MKSYEIQKIGTNRGAPRFYKEGKRIALAGFTPGTVYRATLHQEQGMLLLKVDAAGEHKVSKKATRTGAADEVPVIDLNSKELLGMFEGLNQVRVIVRQGQIVLLALATEVRRKERLTRITDKLRSGVPLDVGSVSHGIGILSNALHKGLEERGVPSRQAFACDIESTYLDQAESANDCWSDGTLKVTAPLQEFAVDEWAMQLIGKVDILEGGIPCTGASMAGRAKKNLAKAEDDPNVGHLMFGFLTLVARLNPAIVVLENVPAYQTTASMGIFRTQMRDLGYDVHERILAAQEFGALENRKRMVAVGVTKGLSFSFDDLALPKTVARTVSEILDPVALDDPSWSKLQYLKDKEVRDKSAGKGFMMQTVAASATSVPTLTRGYMKRRSTDPFLQHPADGDLLRLFTPAEHARIKGVPAHLIKGMSATRAHEALGQGICYAPFQAVGRHIGERLMRQLLVAPRCVEMKQAA
jgi:DNA (cytosine-5)-methyltransferase 1